MEDYRPLAEETLGQYLSRLRKLASISQEMAVQLSGRWPTPQSFTRSWLSLVETDRLDSPGGDKLRTLAAIYGEQLGVHILDSWLLSKAGHQVTPQETLPLEKIIGQTEVLALVAIVLQLLEGGHTDDVRLLIENARRYMAFRMPDADPGAIFKDPDLSKHINDYLESLGLL